MMTSTNETKSNKLMDLVAIVVVITITLLAGTYFFYGDIIASWLSTMAKITIIGAGGTVALGLIGGVGWLVLRGGHGAIELAKKGAVMKAEIELMNERVNLERANTQFRLSEADLNRAESVAKAYQIVEISHKKGALFIANGVPQLFEPIQAPPQLALESGESSADSVDYEWDANALFDTFRKAKALHALLIGSRNGGKSTLLNALMNEIFTDCEITLIDPLFNQVESGWILPESAKISRDFVQAVTEFYGSHKKQADNSTTRRDRTRKILVIDECPALLKQLKATDKKQYEVLMAMMRSLYSNGSHTNHNLILLSQTVLSEDLDLSSNDKACFIKVCLGALSGDYLNLARGKGNKKALYEKLGAVASEFDYYATFEDNRGIIDIQPLPDLSEYGAKRFYGAEVEVAAESAQTDALADGEAVDEAEIVKPSIFALEVMTEQEKAVVDAAQKVITDGKFSWNALHFALTNQPKSGGIQNEAYKQILAKFGLLELVKK